MCRQRCKLWCGWLRMFRCNVPEAGVEQCREASEYETRQLLRTMETLSAVAAASSESFWCHVNLACSRVEYSHELASRPSPLIQQLPRGCNQPTNNIAAFYTTTSYQSDNFSLLLLSVFALYSIKSKPAILPFSAVTLLVWWIWIYGIMALYNQKGRLACKKLGVGLLAVTIWLELRTLCSSSFHYHLHHP